VARKRILFTAGVLLILWAGFSVTTYLVAHKPFAVQLVQPLASSLWSFILTGVLTMNALSVGRIILGWFVPPGPPDSSRIILAGGIGLGVLGLLGFGLAVIGAATIPILLSVQLALLLFLIWHGDTRQAAIEFLSLLIQLRDSGKNIPVWMRWAAGIALALTFLGTLLPPIEAFDALLYHLTIPELWIRDGGLRAYNFPHYWFPGLVEGVFLWGLGLGSEVVPQQMHLLWAVLLALLLWHWTRTLWGDLTAWWALMFLISMPSVLLLAAWAYTDMALTFYGLATLYCLWLGMENNNSRWWIVSGIFAGLAMGIKYTSFVIPISGVILIACWKYRRPSQMINEIARFSIASVITGSVWYLRNWIWMGNPFYPFVFGGRYWDAFRAAAFAGTGTGIGWDWKAILSLPLTVTLGYQDVNYFDGNIGPLFLATLPVSYFLLARFRSQPAPQKHALGIILLFCALSTAFWVYGYVVTKNLWQTRLLLPALVPFIVLSAVSLANIRQLDTRQFRVSFIVYGLAIASIAATLFDAMLGVTARNPLAVAAGITTRAAYFEKHQPAYFAALQLVARTPDDAIIYSLFEPRSYGSPRDIQPDPILDQFPHDLFIYKNPEAILDHWRMDGYTHVLLNIRGANFIYAGLEEKEALDVTLAMLDLIETSPEGEYGLYKIPAP
jgi:hypothetical protein